MNSMLTRGNNNIHHCNGWSTAHNINISVWFWPSFTVFQKTV